MAARSIALLMTWLLALLPAAVAVAQNADPMGQAIAILKALPAEQGGSALAADASAEGHWSFANANGERFTTASTEELKRLLPTLAPEAAKPGARLTMLLTEDTVFRQRAHLQALGLASERRTDLLVAVEREAYPLMRLGERSRERFYAEIRANTLVELTERRLFDEAVWQLAHPLKRTTVRVLALEPGGPETVPAAPLLDTTTRRALTDRIAPGALQAALRKLAGQTVILTARRDGEMLAFRPSSGAEQRLPLKEVLAAAEAADVNLVLLQSANPRQPGTRSWWWGRISVGRLDGALNRDHLADFLSAIASPEARLLVKVEDLGAGRVRLRADPMREESGPRTGIGEALSELASNIVGQVVVNGVEASLRDRARQTELDRRLVPAVPSIVQWIYLGLLAAGLLGHGVARGWWARIWPPEQRAGYGGRVGYTSALVVRTLAYVLVFAPLVAVASLPAVLLRLAGARRTKSASA